MLSRKQLTNEQALQKLKHYCAYQERCHSEVKEKLYNLGVWKKEQDEIIATLIEENYLNEERFASAFVGGKYRIKQWGRVKIRYALKQKQVSEYSIRKALNEIDETEYRQTLTRVARLKYESVKNETPPSRKRITIEYLVQRGFEPVLVYDTVKSIVGIKE